MVQDANGYLLLGTTNGFYRFNGIIFDKIPVDSFIGSQNITAVSLLPNGTKWLGFQNGALAKYSNQKVERLVFEEGTFGKAITKMTGDSSGNIWCGTAGEGLYCYTAKKHWINFNTDDGMSDAYVYDVALAGKNAVLCGTDDGVNYCSWNGTKKEVRKAIDSARQLDKIIRRLLPWDKKSYIAGTQDFITGFVNLNDLIVKSFDMIFLSSSQTNALAKTNMNLWVGTEADGVMYYEFANVGMGSFPLNKWKPFNKIQNLLVDNQQHLWISSDNELMRTEGDRLMERWPMTETDVKQCHVVLASNQKPGSPQRIWFNYEKGLKEIVLKQSPLFPEIIDHPIAAIDNKTEITSLYEDSNNNIWIGTMGKGILLMNKTTGAIKTITEDQLLINGSILSITGKGNNVWISSLGGAVKCTISENGAGLYFTNFNEISGIGTNYIYNIFIDSKERVWFATDGKGLTKLEDGKFTNYNKSSGLKSEVIYSITEDKQGTIWINALNDGLYYFDNKTFTNFSTIDGLSDNNISTVMTDGFGNIVALSNRAVDVIDPQTKAVQTFDAGQGIAALNTDLHSASVSNNGSIIFCTSTGIHQLSMPGSILQPAAFIERTTLFLKDFESSERTSFGSDENNISIHFNAIDMGHPARMQFQYRLEGLSKDWTTTKDHYINYPQLPPGSYTFRVRASMSASFNHSPDAVYTFTIARPYWQRWWFIFSAIMLFGGGLLWLVRYRESRAKQWQQLQKENLQSRLDTLQSQVSPHFFFNSLNTLIALIEEEPKMAVEYTNHLSDFFRKVVQYREKDTIPLGEEIDLITDYFFIQQKRFGSGIRLINHIPKELLQQMQIAPLSLQLLAENAIKHNAFTKIQPLLFELSVNNTGWLEIKNNLQARQNVQAGAGMGLQNIQRRYKLLTGKDVEIIKSDTSFIVKIPLI